ncbi:4-hydroxyphenylacetate 3-monooxygenase, oxygenase component [Diaphorobacter ruginosibacter]|uniref:4-hydroxyphenylacetate 3-monooxygenase, oxygenase component n=1 Tax=Diaphorobacter ruginosibacter TaxID=1715720 RepID=A0A7G9RPN9_9BURK|nr:4-hydroxyphenylacetate 3-hydroxylase N-terminal domain-containing protein [Diaphorobacter ruginosibacter]QNN57564.1 4-hydroxyphenylacetate 3-monooxygenase, oxygenase component [Diaphorobacter ruginosibacter]
MGIRTGKQFLEGLRDEREVYIDGRRVKDVTSDPAFRGAAQTIAELYDLQHAADTQDVLTQVDAATGERVARSHVLPTSKEALVTRGRALRRTAQHTCGLLARTPDFMNVGIAALAAARPVFDASPGGRSFGANITAYHQHVMRNDLTMTHVQVNPQVDRSKQVFEQKHDIALKVVKETDAGFYVSGSRWVGTLAQISDEVVVMPSVVITNDSKGEDYAFAFALPMATPGLKMVSRPSVVPYGAGHYLDNPLSQQFDEGDAVLIFENVFVPWERTFVYRDPDLCNKIYKLTYLGEHYTHQTMSRTIAKAEFMAGLAAYVARSIKVDIFPNVQGMLAELLIFLEMQQAFVDRAEATATETPFGTWAPNRWPLHSAQLNFHERYARMIDVVRTVSAGGLVGVPSYGETQGEIGELVEQYFASAGQTSKERIQLMRLAADASISAFAGRQVLYERYYQGDPVRRAIGYYMEYPKEELFGRVDAMLGRSFAKANLK